MSSYDDWKTTPPDYYFGYQCPECGAELKDGVCPAQEETQAWMDEPDQFPEPEYKCEWVAPDEDGPDGDHQMEYERENRED